MKMITIQIIYSGAKETTQSLEATNKISCAAMAIKAGKNTQTTTGMTYSRDVMEMIYSQAVTAKIALKEEAAQTDSTAAQGPT